MSSCNLKVDLVDTNGNYLKSICTVYEDKTYDEASLFCKSNGLKLYVASTTDEKAAINSFCDVQYPFGAFWVSGKSSSGCTVVSNNEKINYALTKSSCASKAYFHCEYQSEFFLTLSIYFRNQYFVIDPTPSLIVAKDIVESKLTSFTFFHPFL